ncbi:hypothetical protein QC761_0099590 [Podospora bellae-mahoneyi]|uniref:Uncharacterized protein n=1 Tax=Podospora bellae-mahoneyi TaxID=2093777 RepID=A0ABR0FDM1_9PEZI|nr:hypothetical protein QC761_0099590 [Podospora bellae-mahoneyi]
MGYNNQRDKAFNTVPPVVDELSRGMYPMSVDGLGDDPMPLWLILAASLHLDVVRLLGDEIDHPWCEMVAFDPLVCQTIKDHRPLLDFHRDEISKRIKRSGSWDILILGILQQREFKLTGYLRRRLWKTPPRDVLPVEDFQKLKRKLLEDVEYRKTLLFTDEMREDAKRQRVIWFGVENPR